MPITLPLNIPNAPTAFLPCEPAAAPMSPDWQILRKHPGQLDVSANIAGEHKPLTIHPGFLSEYGKRLTPEQLMPMARAINAFTGKRDIVEVNASKYGGDFKVRQDESGGELHVIYDCQHDDNSDSRRITSIIINATADETIAHLGKHHSSPAILLKSFNRYANWSEQSAWHAHAPAATGKRQAYLAQLKIWKWNGDFRIENRRDVAKQIKDYLNNAVSEELHLCNLKMFNMPPLPPTVSGLTLKDSTLAEPCTLPPVSRLHLFDVKLKGSFTVPPTVSAFTMSEIKGKGEMILSEGLKDLIIQYSSECPLPELPASLELLTLRNNCLNDCDFPDLSSLPRLRHLDFSENELTTVPESVLKLGAECTVFLAGNRLTSTVIAAFEKKMRAADYKGPIVAFNYSDNDHAGSEVGLLQRRLS
ncbi:MAG TPA: hypothetical protein VNX00_14220 [Herbaspirillum sp.]|nr:hypothetical protein [Herbaspirillum sp.]